LRAYLGLARTCSAVNFVFFPAGIFRFAAEIPNIIPETLIQATGSKSKKVIKLLTIKII